MAMRVNTNTGHPDHVGKSVAELIVEFEQDIRFDCHGLIIRFGRSRAMQELVSRNRDSLQLIIDHLTVNPPNSTQDLSLAWCWLLQQIEVMIDSDGGPCDLHSVAGWIVWAQRMVEARELNPTA